MVPAPLVVREDDGDDDGYELPHKPQNIDDNNESSATSKGIEFPPPMLTESWKIYPPRPTPTGSTWFYGSPLPSQSPHTALPESAVSSPLGSGSASLNESPTSSATDSDGYASHTPYNSHSKESKHGPPIAPMAVMPIVVLTIIGALVFFCLRKRKKQLSRARAQEMIERRGSTVQPYIAPTAPAPPAALPQPLPPPSFSPTTPTAPTAPEPVILGPITASNNYFTGIDTSDIMSVRSDERTGLGNPFADDHNPEDEPPPPYYPSSVPPLSRESSVRTDAPLQSVSSQTELIGARPTPTRSPFEDPGDDAVSDISVHDARRDGDAMSVVSDLSYQEDRLARRAPL